MEPSSTQVSGGGKSSHQVLDIDFQALYDLEGVKQGEGWTVDEWSERSGISRHRMQKIIKRGVQAEKFVRDSRHVPCDWDGRARTYTVYRLAA